MTRRKGLHLTIVALLAMIFLWLTLRQVELKDIGHVLKTASTPWLSMAASLVALAYVCRVERWRLMLSWANSDLRWSDCAGPLLASFAVNNVVPFRAGDVMRAFAFNHRLGTTPGEVAVTVILERLLDLLIVLGSMGVMLLFVGMDAVSFVSVSGGVLLVIAGAVLSVLLVPQCLTPLARLLAECIVRLAPRFRTKVGREIDKSITMLSRVSTVNRKALLILWSAAVWGIEGCAFWCAALSLPALTSPSSGWLALPVAALSTLVPSTPGYVGTFDYFTARAMAAFGNSEAAATVYAFTIHALVWILPTLAGAAYLLFQGVGQRREKSTTDDR